MTKMLDSAVRELKQTIYEHDGANVADQSFRQAVDHLISVFYDDIGSIISVPLRSLFDLFVIKALYVERQSRDASVIDYLGDMLTRYLYTRELFPIIGLGGRRSQYYFSDLLNELEHGPIHFQNLFEACRKYGDNALFVTGVFPRSFRRGRRALPAGATPKARQAHLGRPRFVNRSYYVSTGKASYRLAAEQELAEFTQQRPTLYKLSDYFEVYMDALNEMSDRYILSFDMNLIADKLLDNFNLYRRSGDERYLENARKYAALLRIDQQHFPALFRRRVRPYIIEN